jgi:hypothetical protein
VLHIYKDENAHSALSSKWRERLRSRNEQVMRVPLTQCMEFFYSNDL